MTHQELIAALGKDGAERDSIQKAEIVTNADKPATESGIEIISQKSTQSGQGKVTFTVGRLGKRQ